MVNADDGSHRSVSYYADRLCYSAKYLSSTVKGITGESPLQIINKHAIKQIKYRLKHSNLSIKEIADSFDFANHSFFGMFVKIYTGMSLRQYTISNDNFYDVFIRLFLNLHKVVDNKTSLNEAFFQKIHKNIFFDYYDSFVPICFTYESFVMFNNFFFCNMKSKEIESIVLKVG